MKEREYLIKLFDIYKGLLSDNEVSYFINYYFEDLSLQEIADNNEVSKAYAGKIINTIEKKLLKYEEILKINDKNSKVLEVVKDLDDIKNKIENIIEQ